MPRFPPPRPISLGDRPWSETSIVESVFANYSAVEKALDDHPGRNVRDRLESIASCLRLFIKSEESIQTSIARFHQGAHDERLLTRRRRHEYRALKEQIQESLFIFCACAMTLVDQARALSDQIEIDGYETAVEAAFRSNPLHRFIQELRVDMIHVTMHEPGWQITSGRDQDRTTKFLLKPTQLRRLDKYHRLAKQYVSSFPDGIDLGNTVQAYREQVEVFQTWLRESTELAASEQLQDFQRCWRIVKATSARPMWRMIFLQVLIQGNRDPYDYLERELTESELDEVKALPFKSKEQVDRIIHLVDDVGACDADLRKIVYQAFGVTDA